MKARDLAIAIGTPILIFFALSFWALGPTLPVLMFHLDNYGWGIGVGYSMYPTIKPGSIVIYDRTPDSIHIGDIIVYYHPGIGLICHRVIIITKMGYVVRGDNNSMSDPWLVKPNQVVGKVVWVVDGDLREGIALFWFKVLGYYPKGG